MFKFIFRCLSVSLSFRTCLSVIYTFFVSINTFKIRSCFEDYFIDFRIFSPKMFELYLKINRTELEHVLTWNFSLFRFLYCFSGHNYSEKSEINQRIELVNDQQSHKLHIVDSFFLGVKLLYESVCPLLIQERSLIQK